MPTDPKALREKLDAMVRFESKFTPEPMSGCWLWTGATANGYGTFWYNGRMNPAHRASFLMAGGHIENGLHLDHLCRNKLCVNPDHLEAVTNKVNVLRGLGRTAQNARKTHCIHGHEFNEKNTHMRKQGRDCKQCNKERNRARYRRIVSLKRAQNVNAE